MQEMAGKQAGTHLNTPLAELILNEESLRCGLRRSRNVDTLPGKGLYVGVN